MNDLPEDFLNTAQEVKKRFSLQSRKSGSPKGTEEQQKAREDQRIIWDGLVSREELGTALRALGFDVTRDELRVLFVQIDADGS